MAESHSRVHVGTYPRFALPASARAMTKIERFLPNGMPTCCPQESSLPRGAAVDAAALPSHFQKRGLTSNASERSLSELLASSLFDFSLRLQTIVDST